MSERHRFCRLQEGSADHCSNVIAVKNQTKAKQSEVKQSKATQKKPGPWKKKQKPTRAGSSCEPVDANVSFGCAFAPFPFDRISYSAAARAVLLPLPPRRHVGRPGSLVATALPERSKPKPQTRNESQTDKIPEHSTTRRKTHPKKKKRKQKHDIIERFNTRVSMFGQQRARRRRQVHSGEVLVTV